MSFTIKHRRIDRRNGCSSETLAVDIESRREASRLVERLADSYARNGRYLPPARWFRDESGLHVIWVQPQ